MRYSAQSTHVPAAPPASKANARPASKRPAVAAAPSASKEKYYKDLTLKYGTVPGLKNWSIIGNHQDTKEGQDCQTYYLNTVTNQTQWEYPKPCAKVAAAEREVIRQRKEDAKPQVLFGGAKANIKRNKNFGSRSFKSVHEDGSYTLVFGDGKDEKIYLDNVYSRGLKKCDGTTFEITMKYLQNKKTPYIIKGGNAAKVAAWLREKLDTSQVDDISFSPDAIPKVLFSGAKAQVNNTYRSFKYIKARNTLAWYGGWFSKSRKGEIVLDDVELFTKCSDTKFKIKMSKAKTYTISSGNAAQVAAWLRGKLDESQINKASFEGKVSAARDRKGSTTSQRSRSGSVQVVNRRRRLLERLQGF